MIRADLLGQGLRDPDRASERRYRHLTLWLLQSALTLLIGLVGGSQWRSSLYCAILSVFQSCLMRIGQPYFFRFSFFEHIMLRQILIRFAVKSSYVFGEDTLQISAFRIRQKF
jgi:hypothetical protein